MNSPCPNVISCPATDGFPDPDYPILNLSSEVPDVDRFLGWYFYDNDDGTGPNWHYLDFSYSGGAYPPGLPADLPPTPDPGDPPESPPEPPPFPPSPARRPAPTGFETVGNDSRSCVGPCFISTIPANVIHVTFRKTGNFALDARIRAAAKTLVNNRAQSLANLRCSGRCPPAGQRLTLSEIDSEACLNSSFDQTIQASGSTFTPFNWEITSGSLPPGMTGDTASDTNLFRIQGTATTAGIYSFTVHCVDFWGQSASKQYTITVIQITTATPLTAGTVGLAYSVTLTATPVPSPIWQVILGSLPPGLSLSGGSGIIDGTPTTVGSSAFTIGVQNGDGGLLCSKDFTMLVAAPVMSPDTPLADATVGLSYTINFTLTPTIPGAVWDVSVGSLPGGLVLNSGTGVMTGVLTDANVGANSFTIRAKVGTLTVQTKAYSLQVNRPAMSPNSPLTDGTAGSSYAQAFTLTPPVAGATWDISVGSLPNGLSFSTAGALSGVLTSLAIAGSPFAFTVRAKLGTTVLQTKAYALTVNAPVISNSATLTGCTANRVYGGETLALTVTPDESVTWAITSGSLPAGMALSSGGVISGTPTMASLNPLTANYYKDYASIVIAVSDGVGVLQSKTFSIRDTAPDLDFADLVWTTTHLDPNTGPPCNLLNSFSATGGDAQGQMAAEVGPNVSACANTSATAIMSYVGPAKTCHFKLTGSAIDGTHSNFDVNQYNGIYGPIISKNAVFEGDFTVAASTTTSPMGSIDIIFNASTCVACPGFPNVNPCCTSQGSAHLILTVL